MHLSTFDLSWYAQWPLRHCAYEEFSRPGLTNFLGSVQVAADPSSFRHVLFPPVSGAEESTAYLTLNNVFLPATHVPVEIRWCPWRVDRSCEMDNWHIASRLCMASGEQGLLLELTITNTSGSSRDMEAALRLSGRCVNRGTETWYWGVPKVAVSLDALLDHGGLNPLVKPIGNRGRLSHERPLPTIPTPAKPAPHKSCRPPPTAGRATATPRTPVPLRRDKDLRSFSLLPWIRMIA